jgi:hypothetical protein
MAQFNGVEARVRSDMFQAASNCFQRLSSGDIFSLSVAGQSIIVLNTQKIAADLLDRRAGIYSDRSRNIVSAEILCGNLAMGFQRYGPMCV